MNSMIEDFMHKDIEFKKKKVNFFFFIAKLPVIFYSFKELEELKVY